jgi:uncharacterized membrane protein YraQ (UPF0718 family)
MAEDLIKQASTKLLSWILGIVAGLMVAALFGGFTFYSEWKADEAAEEEVKYQEKVLMFDTPVQAQETKTHIKEALTPLEQRLKVERDNDFQKEVLKQLKQFAKTDTLNADQIYQMKIQMEDMVKQVKKVKSVRE